ncbi:zf-HC2 domain-containing protein [bacterium]|nr:zf-HC2 domain-containing protein [bacterium]
MIPCERFKDKIFNFLDGELEDDVKEEVQQHLQSCAVCAEFYHRIHSLKQELHNMKPVKAPASFQIVLRERIRHELAHKRGFGVSSPSPTRLWIPAIVMASLILIVSFFIYRQFSHPYLPDITAEAGLTITDEGDVSRIQYVIDDLDSYPPSVQYPSNSSPIAVVDSLFDTESFTPIQDLYQPVRF